VRVSPLRVRQHAEGVVHIVERQAHLLEVVRRLHACGGLADLLHGGDEQADEDGDDGDHYQQLDQREAAERSEEAKVWHGGTSWKRTEENPNEGKNAELTRRRQEYVPGSQPLLENTSPFPVREREVIEEGSFVGFHELLETTLSSRPTISSGLPCVKRIMRKNE